MSARIDLPHVPQWVVPRRRLADRLELAGSAVVTLVTAPAGWGKTLGVASWAANTSAPCGVVWLTSASAGSDPDLFWKLLRNGLVAAGERHLVPVPPARATQARRDRALAQLGAALRHSGPRLLVLDDYPAGQVGALGRELETVLDHAHRALSLIVISRGEPALSLQRHHVAGDLTRITREDLALDRHEVAELLARHDVDAHEFTARTVERHTAGWACGVRLVADALKGAPTVEDAIEAADSATVDYLASEVLARSPVPVRDLIVWTSMVEDVSPDLARAVLGPREDGVHVCEVTDLAFVETGSSGTFRCHPLLRAAASRELDSAPARVRREARRRVAQWHLDHDRTVTGLQILLAGQDWHTLGRALVETYAVPRILAGSLPEVVAAALTVAAVRAAEPLITAALLVGRDGPDAADAVLRVIAERTPGADGLLADELSAIFVQLAVARARGDVETGLPLASRARELMAHLPMERQHELSVVLDAHVGALELCSGQVDRAGGTLQHGAVATRGENATPALPLDCVGQLALLEAFRGNLRQADRYATAVLTRTGPQPSVGVAHAHLATAWVHLERAEQVPARQHLDRAAVAESRAAEPWYATARLLVESGLLVVTGQPEAALRLLAPTVHAHQQAGERSSWTRDQLVLAAVHALLATGEPRMALDLLSQTIDTSPVDTGLLAAKARVEVDDIAGSRTAMARVAADLPGATLATQIECWLLEARLAGESERARVLVDRALREATRETMRRPVAQETSWLMPLVNGDPELRRSYGGFLAGLTSPTHGVSSRTSRTSQSAPMLIETLTAREAQVLGLLAEMCSTEEIAHELFLSVNTVKTYVRGIMCKLGVHRRVDAVRRGRELGLC